MKKKNLHIGFLIAAVLVLNLTAFSKVKMSISVSIPATIKVVIDGHKYYSYDNNITITNLQPGYHNVAVYYLKKGADYDNFYNYGSANQWKKAVSRQVAFRNNFYYDLVISRFGKTYFDQAYNDYYNDWDQDQYDTDFERGGYNENYSDLDFFRKTPNNPIRENEFNNPNSNTNNNYSGLMMNQNRFEQLKAMGKKELMDDGRLTLIKDATASYNITTAQAKELGNLFSFESTKVEFAKYIYDKISDKRNFFTLYDIFTYSSSKDEISEFIKRK